MLCETEMSHTQPSPNPSTSGKPEETRLQSQADLNNTTMSTTRRISPREPSKTNLKVNARKPGPLSTKKHAERIEQTEILNDSDANDSDEIPATPVSKKPQPIIPRIEIQNLQIKDNTDTESDTSSEDDITDMTKSASAQYLADMQAGIQITELHTELPDHLKYTNDDKAPIEIPPEKVLSGHVMDWKFTPYHHEEDLPKFTNGTRALHYFRALRDLLSNYCRARLHKEYIEKSIILCQTPRGLKIGRNIMVIETTTTLKLTLYNIFGECENAILKALIRHYKDILPKLEKDYIDLWNTIGAETVSKDERRLLILKLTNYKNNLMRKEKERAEKQEEFNNKKFQSKNEEAPKGEKLHKPQETISQYGNPYNEEDPKPQRENFRGRGTRGSRGRGRGNSRLY